MAALLYTEDFESTVIHEKRAGVEACPYRGLFDYW
jgi:hypothetical protein